jgi:hypothetical protein
MPAAELTLAVVEVALGGLVPWRSMGEVAASMLLQVDRLGGWQHSIQIQGGEVVLGVIWPIGLFLFRIGVGNEFERLYARD